MASTAITLTDGWNTVDVSKSTVHKNRSPRVAAITAPGMSADTLQILNSEGFVLHIEGDWVLAPGQGGQIDSDYRAIVETWRRANILVNYVDGQQTTWYNIKSFISHLTQGQPAYAPGLGNQSTVIHYALDLTEALRTKERGDLEENPIAGGILVAPSFVSGVSVGEASSVSTRVFPALAVKKSDIIIVFPSAADGVPVPAPTVTDTLSNTYTRQAHMTTTNGDSESMFTAIANADGSPVITINWGSSMTSAFGVAANFRNASAVGVSAGGYVNGNTESYSKIVSTGLSGVTAGSLIVGSLHAGYGNGPYKFTPQGSQVSVLFDNDGGLQDALDIETLGDQGNSTVSYQTSSGAAPASMDYVMNAIELKA